MESQADDTQLRILLRKRYTAGCFYCKAETHTHYNCPKRPCYMCKRTGHLITSCPFRLTPDALDAQRAALKRQRAPQHHPHRFVRQRELSSFVPLPHTHAHDALRNARAVFVGRKIHPARITAAEWSPAASAVITADKRGSIRFWPLADALAPTRLNIDALSTTATTVIPHDCTVNTLAFHPQDPSLVFSSSADGTIARSTIADGSSSFETLYDFSNGADARRTWRMAFGLEHDPSRTLLYAGDSGGDIARLDPRTPTKRAETRERFHADKVTTIQINPSRPDLLVTASNDRTIRMWDARKFLPGQCIGSYTHPRVVNSAFFSPNSGAKLLTTCLDNRLRLWNDIHVLQGEAEHFVDAQPVEVVHSHDFMRHINAFRASWDSKDWRDDTFVCGRYLAEAFSHAGDPNDGPVQEQSLLHPVDIFSASSGGAVRALVDSSIRLICTINRFCPVSDVVLSAASGDIFLWSPPMRKTGGVANDNTEKDDDGSDASPNELLARFGRKRRIEVRTQPRTSKRSKT